MSQHNQLSFISECFMKFLFDWNMRKFGCFTPLSWSMFGKHVGQQNFTSCSKNKTGYSWLHQMHWYENFTKECQSKCFLYGSRKSTGGLTMNISTYQKMHWIFQSPAKSKVSRQYLRRETTLNIFANQVNPVWSYTGPEIPGMWHTTQKTTWLIWTVSSAPLVEDWGYLSGSQSCQPLLLL